MQNFLISKSLLLCVFSFIFSNVILAKNSIVDSTKVQNVPAITVTTTKATERISPVPFNNIERSEIKDKSLIKDLPSLLGELPSIVTFSEGGMGIGYTNLIMRGFDQRRIAVMINGVPQNDPEDHNVYWINFSDINESLENIQVQRGAGLADYGAAAIGGSINLTTSNFVNNPGFRLSTGNGWQSFASDNTNNSAMSKFKFEYSSGLVDGKYAFYGKLGRINSLGYRDQSWANLNNYFLSAVRFDDNLTTQVNAYGGSQDDGLSYMGVPKSYTYNDTLRRANYSYFSYDSTGKNLKYITKRNSNEIEQFSQPHFEILNDYKASNNISFKSTLFFYSSEGYFDYAGGDLSASSLHIDSLNGYPNAKDVTNTLIRGYVSNKQGGWIPKITWKHDNGELTAGIEMRWHRSSHWGKLKFGQDLPAYFDSEFKFYSYEGVRDIYSAFIKEQYKLSDNLFLSGDLQIVNQRYAIRNEKAGNNFTSYTDFSGNKVGTNGANIFDINYTFFNPRAGLNWNIDEHQNIFTSFAITSREPRMLNLYYAENVHYGSTPSFENKLVNGQTVYNFSNPISKPETMTDLELGYTFKKSNFIFQANGYLMQYKDELVKNGGIDLFGNPIDVNAPKTRHYGLELQLSYLLNMDSFGKLKLSTNTTFSKNEILEMNYNFKTSDTTNSTISLKGNNIAGFPEFMLGFGINYSVQDFNLYLNGKYLGAMKTDNLGNLQNSNMYVLNTLGYADNNLDPYFLLNATLNYKFKNILDFKEIKIFGQVNNLLNRRFAAYAIGKEFFPAAERNIYLGIEFGL